MKIRADQLEASLARGLGPLYLVAGDDPLLVQEACDRIRGAARERGHSERLVFEVDAQFRWTALAGASGNLSLFAERRLIELRVPGGRPGDEGGRALAAWCAAPPADTVLLLAFPRIDAQSQKTKWFKAVEAAGVFIPVWPPDLSELPAWIARRMAARGLRPGPGAAAILAERGEGNLLACAQEIEKILLLQGPGPVEADDVLRIAADSARFDVYELVDGVLAGNAARGVRVLRGLEREGVEPPLVLWALTRAVRAIAAFAATVEGGTPLATALRADRVWGRRQALVERALRRHPRDTWWHLLRRAARVDRVIKGQAAGNAWDELLQLSLAIAGAVVPADDSNGEAIGYS